MEAFTRFVELTDEEKILDNTELLKYFNNKLDTKDNKTVVKIINIARNEFGAILEFETS